MGEGSVSAGSAGQAPSLRKSRHNRIAALVAEEGEATVAEMAERFGVSSMTIRRDLRELERGGHLERTHGGAVVASQSGAVIEAPLGERLGQQAAEKRRIATAVEGMVEDGETIFLGSGTTLIAVAGALVASERRLTVVTNAMTIVNCMASADQIELVVVGGFLRREEMSLIGHFAEESLRDIRVDKVIMGVRGLDLAHGLTSDHLAELRTDRAILQVGGEVVIATDHTKFGHVGLSRMAPVTAASTIVTGKKAPPSIVTGLREAGIRVLLV